MKQNANSLIKVVAGLIYRDGKLLVCQRRADAALPLKWEFPGGKVEKGESDIAALCRELQEELAIETHDPVLVCRHTHRYPDGPTVSLRFYNVHKFRGEPKNMIFETIAWVNLVDLDHMDFLEGDRPIIEKLLAPSDSLLLRK